VKGTASRKIPAPICARKKKGKRARGGSLEMLEAKFQGEGIAEGDFYWGQAQSRIWRREQNRKGNRGRKLSIQKKNVDLRKSNSRSPLRGISRDQKRALEIQEDRPRVGKVNEIARLHEAKET